MQASLAPNQMVMSLISEEDAVVDARVCLM